MSKYFNITYLAVILIICWFSTVILAEYTDYAPLIGTIFLLTYIFISFRESKKVLLLLFYPVGIFVLSLGYTSTSFLSAGDGLSYLNIYNDVIAQSGVFEYLNLHAEGGASFISILKISSLGALPTFAVTDYLFDNASSVNYFTTQSLVHISFFILILAFIIKQNILPKNTLLYFTLFVLVSPSFFELGVAPTRHYFTFSAVFLLFYAHQLITLKKTFLRVFVLFLAFFAILISKPPYLFVYLIYVIVSLLLTYNENKKNIFLLLLGVLIISYYVLIPYLTNYADTYIKISVMSMGRVAGDVLSIPILGWLIKYAYAILSPFPWHKWTIHVQDSYNGNIYGFLFHVMSSATGLFFVVVALLNFKNFKRLDRSERDMLLFGLIMSTSILGGATGFHGYISIFFPFFVPLLYLDHKILSALIVITLLVFAEFASLIY